MTTIPFVDFGGSGSLLHFAHANGFPPNAYRPLIETLTPHHRVFSMLFRPLWREHGARPFISHWGEFADDLTEFLEARGDQNLIGVGHSLGAVTTLAVALCRPEFFRAVIVIDPVLLERRRLYPWRMAQKMGVTHLVHPLINNTLRRRRVFKSMDDVFSRYRRAQIFKQIDDTGLRSYVEAITAPRPDGQVELTYSPEWEAEVYRKGPLDLWQHLHLLTQPLLVIQGAQSDTLVEVGMNKIRKILPNAELHSIEGAGHLVPLERPKEVGKIISDFLKNL
ncbi:MAG: alpha/beta hydrolase [Chloroflexi bacterium]|nr:alpha/beta hydrolase [Chloroflexota bacterium]